MKRIGLISDTHSMLDPKVEKYFEEVDEIWHAGDWGDAAVSDGLDEYGKILRGVYGNIDSGVIRAMYPLDLKLNMEGFNIWITHIGGYPGRWGRRVASILEEGEDIPDIFVCGHSHILRVMRDPKYNNMLCLNPGAAGNHGLHKVRTLLRFTLNSGKIEDMEAIELGQRG